MFTAGPWAYDYSDHAEDGQFMVIAPDTAIVAHVWPDYEKGVRGPVVEANARLISAAPDMLDMLKVARLELLLWLDNAEAADEAVPNGRAIIAKIDAAITKAEGRDQ